jgi:hypothetical protein
MRIKRVIVAIVYGLACALVGYCVAAYTVAPPAHRQRWHMHCDYTYTTEDCRQVAD